VSPSHLWLVLADFPSTITTPEQCNVVKNFGLACSWSCLHGHTSFKEIFLHSCDSTCVDSFYNTFYEMDQKVETRPCKTLWCSEISILHLLNCRLISFHPREGLPMPIIYIKPKEQILHRIIFMLVSLEGKGHCHLQLSENRAHIFYIALVIFTFLTRRYALFSNELERQSIPQHSATLSRSLEPSTVNPPRIYNHPNHC